LGLTETIAQDEQQYLDLAIQLGQDRSLRQDLRRSIEQRQSLLFDDQTTVRALEAFYHQRCAL